MLIKDSMIKTGNRMEMFVDDYLISSKMNTALRMNPPQRREIVLRMDHPWEGAGSGIYSVVFKDGDIYRMFYRATFPGNGKDFSRSPGQGCAYAESQDGINWERSSLGIIDYNGQDSNMVFSGPNAHNFSPFLDKNPDCPPEEKYKAIAGHHPQGLMGYKSKDCIHWEPIRDEALITQGAFDSHNVAFYDTNYHKYVCYSRFFASSEETTNVYSGVRAIQHNDSDDFLSWTSPEANGYDDSVPFEHFYTNATVQCPGAEHMYVSFPMRFMTDRHKIKEHAYVGVSDNVIITSRDGKYWDRKFLESWVRPGRDQRNWTQRNLIVAQGIIETGDEFSMYMNENYEWDSSYIRRITVPRFRFGSIYANRSGGLFTTKPILMEGDTLVINYATSAPGSIRVGIIDDTGWPLSYFSTEDCDVIYGDELQKTVTWHGSGDLSFLRGKAVQFKFELKDADIYALQIK